MASWAPSEAVLRVVMISTSVLISETRLGEESMYDSCQNEVGMELVVARKRVLISKLAMSLSEKPHFRQQSSRERVRLLDVRWWSWA